MIPFAFIIAKEIGTPGIWGFRLEKRLQSTSMKNIRVTRRAILSVLWDHVGRHDFGGVGLLMGLVGISGMSTMFKDHSITMILQLQ